MRTRNGRKRTRRNMNRRSQVSYFNQDGTKEFDTKELDTTDANKATLKATKFLGMPTWASWGLRAVIVGGLVWWGYTKFIKK